MKMINWALIVVILGTSVFSRIKSIKMVYFAMLVFQLRTVITLFMADPEFTSELENQDYLFFTTFIMCNTLLFNQMIMNHIFPSRKLLMNCICAIIFLISFLHRLFGLRNLRDQFSKIWLSVFVMIFGVPFFIYINQSLHNLNLSILIDAYKTQNELEVIRSLQKEFQQMFESLQEGIVVV